ECPGLKNDLGYLLPDPLLFLALAFSLQALGRLLLLELRRLLFPALAFLFQAFLLQALGRLLLLALRRLLKVALCLFEELQAGLRLVPGSRFPDLLHVSFEEIAGLSLSLHVALPILECPGLKNDLAYLLPDLLLFLALAFS